MRLLMNAHHLEPVSGIEVQVHETARALASRGHSIDLVHVERGSLYSSYSEVCSDLSQVPALDFYPRHPLRSFREITPAVRAGRARPHDAVYVNRYQPLVWARSVGLTTSTPVVCHVHGMTGAWHPIFNRMIARGMSRILAVSDYIRDEFVKRGVPSGLVRVIHNGIDPQAYPAGGDRERQAARELLGLPQDGYVVLQLGRLHPDKGTELLAEAAASVGGRCPSLHLAYCGKPFAPDHPEALQRLAGKVPTRYLENRHDVVVPLHAADLVVAPTLSPEPFGRVIIEAMSTGRPVVGADVGGIPEILRAEFPDQLFPAGDRDALAELIRRFATWRDDQPELAERSRQLVVDRFTLDGMIDAVEEELELARNSA
jgi:glycosyltransferase involved in cell wall biosynthesis